MPTARPSRWTGAAGVAFAVLVVPCLPRGAAAQQGCSLGEGSTQYLQEPDPRDRTLLIQRLRTPHFICADGVEIWSDSTVAYQYDRMAILYGSVRYVDRQREMRADNARYFTEVGRLQAQGSVFVTNYEDGSNVENGDLVYLRQTDTRPVEEMTFTTGSDGLRPRATVYPKRAAAPVDSTAEADSVTTAAAMADTGVADTTAARIETVDTVAVEPPEPRQYIVVGDRLFFRGDSYFNATGTVEIERDSLVAYADSAEYTGDEGALVLDGSARVDGSTYDLVGRSITLLSAADGSDVVRARHDAVLTGEDLNVTAQQIVLDLVDGEVDHMVAVPLPSGDSTRSAPGDTAGMVAQPRAIAEDFELTGDSLDLRAPGGVLERVFAAGKARSVSTGRADLNVETLPEIARTDWMDADTIEVFLVPVSTDSTASPNDEGNDYEVDHIIARVGARSLYRMIPSDSTAVVGVDPPAVSYMVADQITIYMVDGQADRVESVGQVSGWHLEPLKQEPADSTATPEAADSTTAEPLGDLSSPSPAPSPSNDDGGDAAPPAAYLSPVRASQPWRLP